MMSQSPQIVILPGLGVRRRSKGGWLGCGKLGLLLIKVQVSPTRRRGRSQHCHSPLLPSCIPWWRQACLFLMHIMSSYALQQASESSAQLTLITAWSHSRMHPNCPDFTANSKDLGCNRTSAGKRLVTIFSKNEGNSHCHSE